jgi:hypothetical protein
MSLYLVDPKTKEPSVSLTLMAVSFFVALVAIGLNIAKVTDNTSSAMELLITTAGLYFGRRLNFKGNVYGSDNPADNANPPVGQ